MSWLCNITEKFSIPYESIAVDDDCKVILESIDNSNIFKIVKYVNSINHNCDLIRLKKINALYEFARDKFIDTLPYSKCVFSIKKMIYDELILKHDYTRLNTLIVKHVGAKAIDIIGLDFLNYLTSTTSIQLLSIVKLIEIVHYDNTYANEIKLLSFMTSLETKQIDGFITPDIIADIAKFITITDNNVVFNTKIIKELCRIILATQSTFVSHIRYYKLDIY